MAASKAPRRADSTADSMVGKMVDSKADSMVAYLAEPTAVHWADSKVDQTAECSVG